MTSRTTLATTAAALTGYAALVALGRSAGTTCEERRRAMAGDELVARPQLVTDHALDIDAPPDEVWPWLTQLGWHLGGYYTPAWVDRLLFPQNWSSLDAPDPTLTRSLSIGDVIPDGPPGTAFYRVAEVSPPQVLVLRSTTHVPPGWAERFGAAIEWTWSIELRELEAGRTRLQLRVRGRMRPWWFAALYLTTIPPADYVMATGMLRGLKRRAESGATPRVSGRVPVQQAAYLDAGSAAPT